jgi:O-antigen ligase
VNVFVSQPIAARPRLISRAAAAIGFLVLAALVGGAVIVGLGGASQPSPKLAAIGGIAGLSMLMFALGSYEKVASFGMLILGVVFIQPAPPDAVLTIVIAVAIVTGRFTLRRLPVPILVLIVTFLILNLVSTVFANSPTRAANFLTITTYLCLFTFWVTSYVDSPARARTIIAPLIAGAVASAAIGTAVLFFNFPGKALVDFSDGYRARGFFKDPNVFGPFVVFAAILVVSELLEPRLLRARRPVKLVLLAVLALAILFAYSRAAWLNAAVATVTMIVAYSLRRGGGRKAAAMLVTLVVLVGIGSITLAATGSVGFLGSRAHLQAYDTERFSAQEAGLKLVQSYPLGIGPGQFEHTVGIASHNTYVRVLAEQGIFGLFTILAILLATLGLAARNVVQGRDTFGVGSVALLASFVGILANSAFVDTLHWRHVWLVLALIWAGAMRPSYAETQPR